MNKLNVVRAGGNVITGMTAYLQDGDNSPVQMEITFSVGLYDDENNRPFIMKIMNFLEELERDSASL